ncbi:SpoIIE family protein phosphatase [Streptomyces sp. NPDC059506]|uniref:SpoIIE family protein phosphatase n=1 Tax=unclassified Streptomyces TaxID=2593676 RepID=UPI0015F82883|nr:SpoIIE family protein phosphatase [Streptomyces sp. SCUT-3]
MSAASGAPDGNTGAPRPDDARPDGTSAQDAAVPADTVVRLLGSPDLHTLLSAAVETGLAGITDGCGALYVLRGDGRLRLVAIVGFEEDLFEPYHLIPADSELPAPVAVRERIPVYISDGYFALPLLLGERCVGALFLWMRTPGPPAGSDLAVLEAVAALCAHRTAELLPEGPDDPVTGLPVPEPKQHEGLEGGKPGPRRDPGGEEPDSGGPGRGEPDRGTSGDGEPGNGAPRGIPAEHTIRSHSRAAVLEMAMSFSGIGSFDWDLDTGRVTGDDSLCHLFDIDPDTYDERFETLFAAIHPEDRAAFLKAVDESLTTGSYRNAHRIVLPDGTVRRLGTEGRLVRDAQGRPRKIIGVARDRTAEHEYETRRQERNEFVIDVTRGYAAALSTREVLDTTAETVLPALGARDLAVYVVRYGRTRLIGARGYSDEGLEWLRSTDDLELARLSRTRLEKGEPVFAGNLDEFRTAFPERSLEPPPGRHAWAILPLSTADGLTGGCVISFDAPRTFTTDDRMVCTAVAGILAQSLARSRLFDARRAQMTELQRMMLPQRIPDLPGLEVAARYLPGSEGMEVGGDWYDVLPLPGGRVALVIGDVQGHSAQAAAVMGQLRTAMRAHAEEGHPPAELMSRGNRTLCALDTDLLATCCLVEVDPGAGCFRTVRAGHPYVLMLDPDGGVRELDDPGGLPWGYDSDDRYPVTERTLPPGTTLLLYTDGLVEQHGRDYTEAVADLSRRLVRASGEADRADAGGRGRRGLEGIADRLVAPVLSRQHDDIAVLLVRRTAPPPEAAAADGA